MAIVAAVVFSATEMAAVAPLPFEMMFGRLSNVRTTASLVPTLPEAEPRKSLAMVGKLDQLAIGKVIIERRLARAQPRRHGFQPPLPYGRVMTSSRWPLGSSK